MPAMHSLWCYILIVLIVWHCNAYINPLVDHEALMKHEMEWLGGIPSSKCNDFSDYPPENPFPELGLSSTTTIQKIASTLYCSSTSPLKSYKACEGFTRIADDLVVVLHDEANKSLYFGYSFFVNVLGLTSDHQRLIIYENALKAWNPIVDIVTKYPDHQQFHIGYRTGGSIAALIAFRILVAQNLPFRMVKDNAINQIKVLTISEIPILSSRIEFDPIGVANYAVLQVGQISIPQNGKYLSLGTLILLKGYRPERSQYQISADQLAHYLPLREKAKVRLESMTEKKYQKIKSAVYNHLQLAREASSNLLGIFPDFAPRLYSGEHNICVEELEQLVSDYLPRLPGHGIKCRLQQYEKASRDEFQIRCMLHDTKNEGEASTIATFDAKLALFKDNVCSTMVVPNQRKDKWNNCMSDLASNSDDFSLIYSSEKNDNCRFLPGTVKSDWIVKPKGCFVKSTTSDRTLLNMYEKNPRMFFSLFNHATTEYPTSCQTVLYPAFYPTKDLEWIEGIMDTIAHYLDEMNEEPDGEKEIRRKAKPYNNLPALFHSRSTESFTTYDIKLSSNHFVADSRVVSLLTKCIRSKNAKFVNCNEKSSQWIPGACPDFCSAGKEIELCNIITYCDSINAYVGIVVESFLPQTKTAIIPNAQTALESSTIAQHAIFAFSQRTNFILNLIGKRYWMGLFFTEMPHVKKISPEELRKKRQGKNIKRNADDIWNDI